MIQEAYVSYEVAKLLKEKGFIGDGDIGSRNGFYVQNKSYPSEIGLCYDDLDNKELDWNECLRLTQAMAMAWLREEHNLHLDFTPFVQDGKVYYDYVILQQVYNCQFIFDGELQVMYNEDSRDLTYEEACEAAIKYCLENLI